MTDAPAFRSVLRGYEPTQVDQVFQELRAAVDAARQEAAERTVEVSKLTSVHEELRQHLAARDSEIASLHEAQRRAAAPTFADLGQRIGAILGLADEEATDLRATAERHAAQSRKSAEEAAVATRSEADRYAVDVRSKADAESARILEDARSKADEILDAADREASARREEAEAVFESQRAKAAAAAADFETTLAHRRDKAAEEFTAAMGQHERSLASIQERAGALAAESQAAHESARAEAAAMLEHARAEAAHLVAAARDHADRIKRDSDRELAAATARRDSITAQLTNVRQMLATLGGGVIVNPLADLPSAPAPAHAVAADREDPAAVDGEAADDEGHGSPDESAPSADLIAEDTDVVAR
ncbi:MAG TPA: hypothetical protein PLL54_02805 [Dermatophilaceae bacterium]|nr:hypothetical protein [Dermatophilaceae bacterium]